MKKIALVACSNPLSKKYIAQIEELKNILSSLGIECVQSEHIYLSDDGKASSALDRANALNAFYRDESVDAVFDISGGDLANGVLPFLDYGSIKLNNKPFFGYSDLTSVINAIYAKTGNGSVLFQLRTLTWSGEEQIELFKEYLNGGKSLFKAKWTSLRGECDAQALIDNYAVLGGNIRCLLKLAGTEYFPNFEGKVMFLEALRSGKERVSAYGAQLCQMGAFKGVKGVLLGTFTELEKSEDQPSAYELLKEYIPENIPVFKTCDIGHAVNSKAIVIG